MMANTNIYLDIDGVLLTKDLKPANHALEFLKYVLINYPDNTYWLTTHCQGDASVVIRHIGHLFDTETLGLMKNIKPTKWDTAKTRAIDFSKPFLWFDDNLFYEDEQTLRQNICLDNFIKIDLIRDSNILQQLTNDFPVPVSLTMFTDDECMAALRVILDNQKAATTLLQKELKIGYARALHMMIKLEHDGFIVSPDGDFLGEVNSDKITKALQN